VGSINVELRVEARNDLVDAALFYDGQRAGLGDYFTECLFRDLGRLKTDAAEPK
jgi:hypothetical protein